MILVANRYGAKKTHKSTYVSSIDENPTEDYRKDAQESLHLLS